MSSQGGGKKLTNQEMKDTWPALQAMPDDFAGFLAEKAGVVKARDGLQACKKLCLEQGADLRFNISVASVDAENGIVKLETGEVLRANHVVVCCGAFTDQFYTKGAFQMDLVP